RNIEASPEEKDTERDPRIGDEAHFINPENLGPNYIAKDGGPETAKVSLDYKKVEDEAASFIATKYANPSGNQKIPTPHQLTGSNWWRTRQLYQKAIDNGKAAIAQIETLIWFQKAYDYRIRHQNTLRDFVEAHVPQEACDEKASCTVQDL